MLLWGIQQPTLSKPNAFVSQASYQLSLDSCGHSLHSSIPFFLGISLTVLVKGYLLIKALILIMLVLFGL